MKLLSVQKARSIWLLYLMDLNPRGLYDYALIAPMIEKYKFLKVPTKFEEYDLTKGCVFANGLFKRESQDDIGIDITLYNDGFVVDSRSSTEDSDAFLDDFLTWLSKDFALIPYKEILRRKLYISELWMQANKPLNALNAKLEGFAKRLSSLMFTEKDHPIVFETSGIRFWTDPSLRANPPGQFTFERSLNTPFNENRYYSAAPLQTGDHLELLEELEIILGS